MESGRFIKTTLIKQSISEIKHSQRLCGSVGQL